jgi:protein-S-isoprenylcysteine O-methyltransferase Ste14
MPQWIYNVVLALWLLSDALRAGRAALGEAGATRWLHWSLVLILSVNAWFALRRHAPAARAVTWVQVFWVLMATAWPVLYTLAPAPPGPTPPPALLLQFTATAIFGASVYALGGSFSVFPERRAIVSNGVYGWVRHPMYASYLLLDLGFWLANPQAWFAVVWVVEVLLLEARTRWEEAVLVGDPAYVAYQREVPWRLIPGLL